MMFNLLMGVGWTTVWIMWYTHFGLTWRRRCQSAATRTLVASISIPTSLICILQPDSFFLQGAQATKPDDSGISHPHRPKVFRLVLRPGNVSEVSL